MNTSAICWKLETSNLKQSMWTRLLDTRCLWGMEANSNEQLLGLQRNDSGTECLGKSGKTSTLAVFFVVDVIVMFLSHLSSVNIFANLRIGSCSSCWMGREHCNV